MPVNGAVLLVSLLLLVYWLRSSWLLLRQFPGTHEIADHTPKRAPGTFARFVYRLANGK